MAKKIICYCKNVSEQKIIQAKKNGAKSLKDIQKMTGACTGDSQSLPVAQAAGGPLVWTEINHNGP